MYTIWVGGCPNPVSVVGKIIITVPCSASLLVIIGLACSLQGSNFWSRGSIEESEDINTPRPSKQPIPSRWSYCAREASKEEAPDCGCCFSSTLLTSGFGMWGFIKKHAISNGTRTEVVLGETRRQLDNWKIWAKDGQGVKIFKERTVSFRSILNFQIFSQCQAHVLPGSEMLDISLVSSITEVNECQVMLSLKVHAMMHWQWRLRRF